MLVSIWNIWKKNAVVILTSNMLNYQCLIIIAFQRKDYTALSKYLCEKLEFIVKVRLTPLQIQLYRLYLDTQTNRGSNPYAVSSDIP